MQPPNIRLALERGFRLRRLVELKAPEDILAKGLELLNTAFSSLSVTERSEYDRIFPTYCRHKTLLDIADQEKSWDWLERNCYSCKHMYPEMPDDGSFCKKYEDGPLPRVEWCPELEGK